ncbi:MAG: hypothetical protein ACE5GB_01720 [Acidimicrobiales bacterium]
MQPTASRSASRRGPAHDRKHLDKLPAHVGMYVSGERPSDRVELRITRAVGTAAAVSVGLVGVFTAVGLMLHRISGATRRQLPWVTIVIGGLLVVTGVAVALGSKPRLAIRGPSWGAKGSGVPSMAGYGVSYAIASLSCTIGPFPAVTGDADGRRSPSTAAISQSDPVIDAGEGIRTSIVDTLESVGAIRMTLVVAVLTTSWAPDGALARGAPTATGADPPSTDIGPADRGLPRIGVRSRHETFCSVLSVPRQSRLGEPMMDDKAWEKYGSLGGIWFAVLTVVGSLLAGAPPSRTDDAAEILEWYADNDTNIQVGALLAGLAVFGLIWWFGSLWQAMVKAGDGSSRVAVIALAGFAFSGAMAFAGFTVNAATAADIDTIGAGSSFFFGLSSVFYGFASIGTAVLVLAVSGLALRSGFLPGWLAQVGFVVAAAEIVSGLSVASDASFFGLFGFISFLAWALWTVIVSWLLYQSLATTSEPGATTSAEPA